MFSFRSDLDRRGISIQDRIQDAKGIIDEVVCDFRNLIQYNGEKIIWQHTSPRAYRRCVARCCFRAKEREGIRVYI